jgi:undecaprenyl-diphosphatase
VNRHRQSDGTRRDGATQPSVQGEFKMLQYADEKEAAMRHRRRPLLWDARHTRAWPVLTACVFVIAALGLLLRGQARPDGVDSAVDAAMVASLSGHRDVLPWLALPGSTIPLITVSVAIAIGCLIARRPNGAVLAVTAVPVTAFLDDTVLKHLVGRTHLGQLSFPSGHTASAMTLATVLGVLLHDPARRTATRAARAVLVIAACAVTVLVAVGVIGLRWHYFTDTVGGVALGTGTVLALAFLIDLVPRPAESRTAGPGWGRRRTGSADVCGAVSGER